MTESGKKTGTILTFLRARLDEESAAFPSPTGAVVLSRRFGLYHADVVREDLDARRQVVESGNLMACKLLALRYLGHPDYDPSWRQ